MRTQGAGAGKPRRMLPSPMSRPAPDEGAAKAFKLEIIDLDAHPDGKLLRACARATKLLDKLTLDGIDRYRSPLSQAADELRRLTNLICATEALTPLGLQMKAMLAVGDEIDPDRHTIGTAPFVSVIRDFLRMGVPA